MKKRVLVPFTTGVEEIEFTAIVDILRRADIEVVTASLDGQAVIGRSNMTLQADAAMADVKGAPWDMVVLPGGLPNAHLLRDHADVKTVVQRLRAERKTIAAICAAPTALAAYGITENMRVTSYPSCQPEMETLQPSSVYSDDIVVEDDFLVTSRGPGTAVEFALHLVKKISGETLSENIRCDIVAS